jgi:hypothetical protein
MACRGIGKSAARGKNRYRGGALVENDVNCSIIVVANRPAWIRMG